MKKLIIIIHIILTAGNLFAQTNSEPNPKFLISVEAGTGLLFGNSNLSPWGIQYRDQYKNGFVGNLKAFYLFGKIGTVGVKYSFFSDSENYLLEDNLSTANNAIVHYIAPQIGFRKYITPKLAFGYVMGVGLARYQNEGLIDTKEFKATSNAFAGNFDFTFDYTLFGNIAAGINLSLTGCHKFKKINMDEKTLRPDKWNQLKFFRADFSVGIKGYF